jgi:hypothetical protein
VVKEKKMKEEIKKGKNEKDTYFFSFHFLFFFFENSFRKEEIKINKSLKVVL